MEKSLVTLRFRFNAGERSRRVQRIFTASLLAATLVPMRALVQKFETAIAPDFLRIDAR
jgi:hypothetical protein